MYKQQGVTCFSSLRGSFAGAIYEKAKNSWVVFTDQLGTKFVYYALEVGFFACAEMFDILFDDLQTNGIDCSLDVQNAKLLLSYGFMVEDRTHCDKIRKIQPGCYIVYENGQIREERYYMLDNTPDNSMDDEKSIISKIDNLFRQAVIRQFEKDKEYGYKHIVALSGGLDSRMTSFVAHDCGYTDQLNCTFSQTNYWDETLPKKMADFLKHEWLFKSLDNGIWLKDVDEVVSETGGNVAYHAIAHGRSLIKYINFENLGLSHTGQLGDVVLATKQAHYDDKFEFGEGAYMRDNIELVDIEPSMQNLNKEIGLYYYRYLNGTNGGIQYLYNYTESLSPFLDIDFMEFAFKIPYKYRRGHYIYKKWIIQKYPEAAAFEWESIGCKITDRTIRLKGQSIPFRNIPKRVLSKLGMVKSKQYSKSGMNPLGYYLRTNESLYAHLMDYYDYEKYIQDDNLKYILKRIKEHGNPVEKLLAVSLLGVVKRYYS